MGAIAYKKQMVKLIFIILFSIIAPCVVATDLNINQFSFSYGDDLEISLGLSSPFSSEKNVDIRAMIGAEDRDFVPRPVVDEILLSASGLEDLELYSFQIDENFKEGNYWASVEVYYGANKIGQDSLNFFVANALDEFSLDLDFCKDQSCSEKTKFFIQNEDIYMDYTASIESPIITASLIYPDNTVQQIELPTLISANQIGTHTLEVTASKEGYNTVKKTGQFGVIEKTVYEEMRDRRSEDVGEGFLSEVASRIEDTSANIIDTISTVIDNAISPSVEEETPEEKETSSEKEEERLGSKTLLSKYWPVAAIIIILILITSFFIIRHRKKGFGPEYKLIKPLVEYVEKERNQGFKDEEIKEAVIKAGWKKTDVDKVFKNK